MLVQGDPGARSPVLSRTLAQYIRHGTLRALPVSLSNGGDAKVTKLIENNHVDDCDFGWLNFVWLFLIAGTHFANRSGYGTGTQITEDFCRLTLQSNLIIWHA